MSGKGSAPRPFDIPHEEYASNHDRIFGARKPREPYVPPPIPDTEKNNSQERKE